MTVAPGTLLGGYRIEAVAGRGGMGVVYQAVQEGLGRPVALKLIAPELARDPEFRARFVRESRLAASLDHPHVIPVYEAGEEDGNLFIAMRWVEGPDLRDRVAADGPLAPALAAAIAVQVGGALDAAHARGLVHRDVKPANVLLAGDPDEPHAYLSDFGLARSDASTDPLTRTGGVMGTAAYSAPEQIEGGPVDGRADVYALACVLFFALTGRPPFRRDTELATAWAQVHESPPTLRSAGVEASSALELALARALGKDPAERPATAGAFAAEVAGATPASRAGRTVGPPAGGRPPPRSTPSDATRATQPLGGAPRGPDAPTARLRRTRRRRPIAWVVGVVVLCALVGLGLSLGLEGDEEPDGGSAARDAPTRADGPAAPRARGDVVRCTEEGSCRQGGHAVTEPVEDDPCGGNAAWDSLEPLGGDEALYACLGEPAAVPERVPDLAGAQLDSAEEYLDERGVAHETVGGGTFGVVVPTNWTVCDTDPPVGNPLDVPSLTLLIGRTC